MQKKLILSSVLLCVSVPLCETRAMPPPHKRPPLTPSDVSRGIGAGALLPLGKIMFFLWLQIFQKRRMLNLYYLVKVYSCLKKV